MAWPSLLIWVFGRSSLRRGKDKMASRVTAPMLLLLASVCTSPGRPAAANEKENEPGATRPAISQEVAPLEAIAPVAKDGHKGEAYVRKPPGKGPFPAVVLIHGGIVRWPTTALKEYALGAWSSRYLAAGYVVAVTTYRSRDVDPQTRESPDDALATVEYVRKLSYVDPKSIAVNGTSGGGALALTVATETDVAVIVLEEPAGPLAMGVLNKNTPKTGERFTPVDGRPFWEDPKKFYTTELQKSAREKLARIRCPILLLQGDLTPGNNFNKEILIPELRDLGKSVVVLTYPGEPHSFAFYSTPARTPRPAVAENAFEDVNVLIRRHLPTKPSPIEPSLVKQVPFEAK
jgi:dipeptidyl aminopeptidase/acylaminoacyl peptidase